MVSSALIALALLCAAVMGYAIQRGATCMVAAVAELVEDRRASRLIALGEAALWVAIGLAVAAVVGGAAPGLLRYPVTAATILGGALLGLGALLNGACVFGAIARLGSGEWAYVATPVGFLFGCIAVDAVTGRALDHAAAPIGPVNWGAIVAIGIPLVAWRAISLARAGRAQMLAAHVWSPHVATAVIGIAFVIMMLAVGSWAYTDALAQLAHGMAMDSAVRLTLFLALLGGAVLGGWTAGRSMLIRPTPGATLRCLVGGALMGVGSLLIPGGNDGLILVGLPLLQPYAVAALAAMTLTIMLGMLAMRRIDRRRMARSI